MFVLNVSMFKSKIYILIICAIVIAMSLVVYSMYNVFNVNINDNITFENCTSYYLEYDLTVVSNKNNNTYKIEETYDGNNFLFKFKDFCNNDVEYKIINNELSISNASQLNKYILQNNIKKNNLFSLYTYINIINNKYCFDIDKIDNSYIIHLNRLSHKSCHNDLCNDIYNEGLKLTHIIVNDKNITVYRGDDIYLNVEYSKYELNKGVKID